MSGPELQTNLDRLLAELTLHADARADCCQRRQNPNAAGDQTATEIPLFHARGPTGFLSAVSHQRLLSKRQLIKRSGTPPNNAYQQSTEYRLGTDGYIFCYAGPCRFGGECAFVFAPGVEHAHASLSSATPFDSGGLTKGLRPNDTDEQRREFLQRHEMPVPDYRGYLRAALVTLFALPVHYIDGTGPDQQWPIDVQGGDARRWTFEFKCEGGLPLEGLLAVFVPRDIAMGEAVLPQIERWKGQGVSVTFVAKPTGADDNVLLEKTIEYIRSKLRL